MNVDHLLASVEHDLAGVLGLRDGRAPGKNIEDIRRQGWLIALPLALVLGAGAVGMLEKTDGFLKAVDRLENPLRPKPEEPRPTWLPIAVAQPISKPEASRVGGNSQVVPSASVTSEKSEEDARERVPQHQRTASATRNRASGGDRDERSDSEVDAAAYQSKPKGDPTDDQRASRLAIQKDTRLANSGRHTDAPP